MPWNWFANLIHVSLLPPKAWKYCPFKITFLIHACVLGRFQNFPGLRTSLNKVSAGHSLNYMSCVQTETEEIRDNVTHLTHAMRTIRNKTNDVDQLVREMMGDMREMKVALETTASTSTYRLDGTSTPIRRSVRGSRRNSREASAPQVDVLTVPQPPEHTSTLI